MDNDDEASLTPTPDNFCLSTYKENFSININQTKIFYKCYLCRKIRDNSILTCSKCINTGQFCSSKHEICSNKRRNLLLNLLNKNDYEEFQQQYSSNKSIDLLCSERMFLLKKFNLEKKLLQSEFQIKIKSSIETRQMLQEIQIRKIRHNLIKNSIEKLQEEIEQKKQLNIKTQQRINEFRSQIKTMKNKLNDMKQLLQSSNDKIQEMIKIRTKHEEKLYTIRRERFNELNKYLFPIECVSAIEESLATRIKALSNAQQTTMDEINNERIENDDSSSNADCRYRIVDSYLPSNGNYQIDNLHLISSIDAITTDLDSPQSSLFGDLYEILSGLSHVCHLINVIAFYLHIHLPFRLHQFDFNTDNLTIDCIRANIAKLNANIIYSCLSQDIPFKSIKVTYTIENLLQLLKLEKYPSRPISVDSKEYIDMIKKVNDISGIFITDYWFDDDDEKDETDYLNSDEWEAVQQDDYIPDDPSIYDHGNELPLASSQQHSSIMSSSMNYLKKKFWSS